MRAVVFSDSHSSVVLMKEAVQRVRSDVIIHLGDNVRDAEELREEFRNIPLYCVRGNCDMASAAPETDIVPLGSVKAFITHGHLYDVKWGQLDRLVYAAMEQDARIAMYGHTHQAEYREIGGIKLLNPGTAGRGREKTFAVVDVFENGGFVCEIRNL